MWLISPNFDVKSINLSQFGQEPFPKIAGKSRANMYHISFHIIKFQKTIVYKSCASYRICAKHCLNINMYMYLCMYPGYVPHRIKFGTHWIHRSGGISESCSNVLPNYTFSEHYTIHDVANNDDICTKRSSCVCAK